MQQGLDDRNDRVLRHLIILPATNYFTSCTKCIDLGIQNVI